MAVDNNKSYNPFGDVDDLPTPVTREDLSSITYKGSTSVPIETIPYEEVKPTIEAPQPKLQPKPQPAKEPEEEPKDPYADDPTIGGLAARQLEQDVRKFFEDSETELDDIKVEDMMDLRPISEIKDSGDPEDNGFSIIEEMIKDIDGTWNSWEEMRESLHNFAFDHIVAKPKGLRMLKDRRTDLIEKAELTPAERISLQQLNSYITKIESIGTNYIGNIKYKNWQRNWGKRWLKIQLKKARKKGRIPDWLVPIVIIVTSEGKAIGELAMATRDIPNYNL